MAFGNLYSRLRPARQESLLLEPAAEGCELLREMLSGRPYEDPART